MAIQTINIGTSANKGDGDPLRVDYVNGNIIFGSDSAGKPDGYVVQVNNFEEPRTLKEVKASLTNRLLLL